MGAGKSWPARWQCAIYTSKVPEQTECRPRLQLVWSCSLDDISILRAIFDETPECIKIIARDGTLLRMNAAGRAMIEAADDATMEGASVYDLVAPEFRRPGRKTIGASAMAKSLAGNSTS